MIIIDLLLFLGKILGSATAEIDHMNKFSCKIKHRAIRALCSYHDLA
jgi:hypothetical protein